ncbi:MAG: beta-N-acetylglucosaminidase [Flavobacteriaceae bacterium]|nr:beta-N-acetylglucosaminidase [Flavobacteriaceae bacterium]
MKYFLSFFSLFFLLFSTYSQSPLSTLDSDNQKKWVDSVYNSLTIDQKIGQLFTIWVASKEGSEKMNEISEIIKKNHLGGLIFSLGNLKDQAIAANKFQSVSKVPLLIGMDAEWGIGMRLDDAFSFPFNMTLGAIEDDSLVYEVGKRIGLHAKRLGVHINFAPVTDINTNPQNPIIGSRSFGEDKLNVTKKSLAYLKGMQSEGIMGSAKHFPGHGDTSKDSHKTLPIINFSSKRIHDIELYPYKELIKNNLSAVMVAHMEVPSLERLPKLPSTLSKNIVTKILKKKLKFKGLVITDAMDMKGVVDFNKDESADVSALLAGNDILLMPDNLDQSTTSIKKALNTGKLTEKRLAISVKKILMAKYKAGLNKLNDIKLKNLTSDLNNEEDKLLFEKLAKNSITIIKNENQLLPLKDLSKKIAYIKMGDSNSDEFFKMLNHYTKVENIGTDDYELDKMIKILDPYDLVIIGFHKSYKSPFEDYRFSKEEIRAIELISQKKNVVLDVFTKPYALIDLDLKNIKSIVVSYQNNNVFQSISSQIIFGALSSKGILPVSIGKNFPVNSHIKTNVLNRLSYSSPKNQGFDTFKLNKIDSIARFAIKKKMIPGAQILVAKNGDVIYNKSFGYKKYESSNKVKWDDIYDLASLTKILSSVPLLMNEYELENINLETTLSDLFPNMDLKDKKSISIKEMLSHQAGLFPWIPFYKKTIDSLTNKPLSNWYKSSKKDGYSIKLTDELFLKDVFLDTINSNIINSDLSADKFYVYSDLPYYFIKNFLENKNKNNLDDQLKKILLLDLGANRTTYNPTLSFSKSKIVPSEIDNYFRNTTLHGYVHDMGAAMQGGIGGHAGLFSNSNDVAKIMQMYLQGGYYGGKRFFKTSTINDFNTCYFCENNNRRGIGFDKPQLDNSKPTCGCVPMSSFGHSGFTGTYTWADPENKIVYVFLSNRTFPTMENKMLYKYNIRTEIQRVIYESFN